MRTFPAQQCQYTLPGDDWSWPEAKGPNMFLAVNSQGLVVSLMSLPVSPGTELNQKYIEGWEKGLFKNPDNKKRGGRFTSFLGIPCYQCEQSRMLPELGVANIPGVHRVFVAHGNLYDLILTGGKEPVEQHPDFEKIMGGFAFTTPVGPVAPTPAPEPEHSIADLIGKIAVWCLGLAGVLAFLRWSSRKKAAPPSES